MPASNVFRLGLALQATKGTPAAAPDYWVDVTSSDIGPAPETEQRSETGLGRDPGETYIRVLGAGGSASVILRPQTAPLFFYGALGAKSTTADPNGGGAGVPGAPYNHVLTPANDQPYFTMWRELGDMIYEQFVDCKITGCNVEWAAGGDVTASLTVVGLSFTRLTSSPAGGTYDNGAPFRVPGVVYTIEGAVDNSLTQGNVNIEAGQTAIQTVNITNSYLEPGQRNITLGWEQVASDVDRYAKTYYGGPTGTNPAETVYEGAVLFEFGEMAPASGSSGPGLSLDIPRTGFTETTANPDPGGDPLRYPVAGQAFRPASGSIITATVVNGVSGYTAA